MPRPPVIRCPCSAAADAVVVLKSAGGTRRVPFTAFYTGYRQTVRRPDELIVAFEIPAIRGRQCFRKVGTRAAQAISKVVIAAVVGDRPRIALGSVGADRRPREADGSGAGRGRVDRGGAADARSTRSRPIDDIRSTAEYRRRVAANLLALFWNGTAPTVE